MREGPCEVDMQIMCQKKQLEPNFKRYLYVHVLNAWVHNAHPSIGSASPLSPLAAATSQRRSETSAGSGQPPPVPYGLFLNLLLAMAERLFTPYCSVDAELGDAPPPTPFTPQQCLQKLLMEHIFVETEKDEMRIRK